MSNQMTIIEKILAAHADKSRVSPGDIVDIEIDVRIARDFGGANVVKNLQKNGLTVKDPKKTYFTFDCNPTGSDQKYAENQQLCRKYARSNEVKVYDINAGIGTHIAIDKGLVYPGATAVSTDSHANILGAIGAFGQGMGDMDTAAAWAHGKLWFKVPKSMKITLQGERPTDVTAKDIVLNMLSNFGSSTLLGYSVEMYGDAVEKLTLDERITVASMATELGAIILLFPPSHEITHYCEKLSGKSIQRLDADGGASYEKELELDIASFKPMVALPGHPHDDVSVEKVKKTKIDSAFIGSCTNGRMEDMHVAAEILKGRKVAPGVVLKIVPATEDIWNKCLEDGTIEIFKKAGALVGNAGCAGCAAGQIGQNGPGEVTVSTGNRNFAGKQGKGEVYLASPAVAASSAVAGYITTPDEIPDSPAEFVSDKSGEGDVSNDGVVAKATHDVTAHEAATQREDKTQKAGEKDVVAEGRVWVIPRDDIDTDMIFHNSHLTITDIQEMGKYTFGNLDGWKDFAQKAKEGDIVIAGKNFGSGSSRQQAVDCFKSLGVQAVIAESFGAIYERNAVNAAFPIMTYSDINELDLKDGDRIKVDFEKGTIQNLRNNKSASVSGFSDVQMEIYKKGGLL